MVRGIDTRPATGQVYVWTVPNASANNSTVQTYTLDTKTGAIKAMASEHARIPYGRCAAAERKALPD